MFGGVLLGHTLTFNTGASPHTHVPVYVFMYTLAIYRWILSHTYMNTDRIDAGAPVCVCVRVYLRTVAVSGASPLLEHGILFPRLGDDLHHRIARGSRGRGEQGEAYDHTEGSLLTS